MSRDRVRLGQLPLDPLTFPEALDAIEALARKGEGGSVFTPNVDHFVLAEEDPRFRAAYQAASLSLVDGTPVLWACRLLGLPIQEKVSGSDLTVPLAERAAARGLRLFFLGGAGGVAEKAAAILRSRFPALDVAGMASPSVDMSEAPSAREPIYESIRRTRPDLLLVALGTPKGELFAHEAREAVRPAVVLSVGASLDFIAGTARRAPRLLSTLGLEWLFRLAQEPKRLWRRYLVRDPQFALIVLRALRNRGTRSLESTVR